MWALYALLSAFGWASSDAVAKRAMERGADGRFLVFVRYVLSIPLLLPFLSRGIPPLDATFWLLHLPWIPLETAALYLYIHAIRISPLSLTLPLLSLTPLFLVFTGWIFLGERVGVLGFLGILLVVIGSYVLNLQSAREGPLEPFRAIFREKGSRYMVIVAFIYSLTSILGKQLVRHSDPFYFSVHYAVAMSVALAPAGLRTLRPAVHRPLLPLILLSALFFSLMILFHMLAIQIALVAYMIALKRLSGTFGVIYGRVFFGERAFGTRLLGSLMMVAGGVLITAGG